MRPNWNSIRGERCDVCLLQDESVTERGDAESIRIIRIVQDPITYTATDNAGNKMVASITVTVPHDQSGNH